MEVKWEIIDWIYPAQDRKAYWAIVKTVIKLRVFVKFAVFLK